ncbi:MAG: hypothetical protein JXQ65_07385 [Candidatus Marinimicrobia bacterium]|nr:hypothetical protein [Candidatus Neomarinimicrobiota bacterium]
MKKVILIVLGGLLLFVVLVALVFVVLTYLEKNTAAPLETIDKIPTEENNSILGILLAEKQAIIDSLSSQKVQFEDSLAIQVALNDSLETLLLEKSNFLSKDSTTISKLTAELAKIKSDIEQEKLSNQITEEIRQLAKTYEQMKISEMKPIFDQLDDKTVIALYNAMSARKKPMVLKALNTDRAAKLTRELSQ